VKKNLLVCRSGGLFSQIISDMNLISGNDIKDFFDEYETSDFMKLGNCEFYQQPNSRLISIGIIKGVKNG
jgi:hypothetical protein